MTYCVGILLDAGLVMASDSRTNAGVDNIATFRKMTVFERPGERVITLLSAGNLAATQAVLTLLDEWTRGADKARNILEGATMFRVARIVGEAVREVHRVDAEALRAHSYDFNATFLLGGQIRGERHRLFHIYTAGNFIEATPETRFLQTGEIKYGKPVFDRLLESAMPLADAAKLALISFDSTMRSNLSVGLPIDMLCYRKDSLASAGQMRRFAEGDPYLAGLRTRWGEGLKRVFDEVPALEG